MDREETTQEILDSMAGVGGVRYIGSGTPEQNIESRDKSKVYCNYNKLSDISFRLRLRQYNILNQHQVAQTLTCCKYS